MTPMFKEIDNEISKQLKTLKQISNEIEFEYVCQFRIKNQIDEIPWIELEHEGLYLFEIQIKDKKTTFEEWIKDFQDKWQYEKYRGKSTPSLKKKRITFQKQNFSEWLPIYIGKKGFPIKN